MGSVGPEGKLDSDHYWTKLAGFATVLSGSPQDFSSCLKRWMKVRPQHTDSWLSIDVIKVTSRGQVGRISEKNQHTSVRSNLT